MRQDIVVFQQNGSGQAKIKGIETYGNDRFSVRIVSIDSLLPAIIDDSGPYLPTRIRADLALDFLTHPDLSYDLARRCHSQDIPVVASGKKHRLPQVYTPPTWCGLPRQVSLGIYGERFGKPIFDVGLAGGNLERIAVTRGAPCGATWSAAQRVIGMPAAQAVARIGLEVQFFCVADPSAWDPIHGTSPVHFAGRVHAAALREAVAGRA